MTETDRLREALRLIELLGYREGEQNGWLVAHMRGVATDALEGRRSEHVWRLFPKHRATETRPMTDDMIPRAEAQAMVAAALREAADKATEWWDDPQMHDATLAALEENTDD